MNEDFGRSSARVSTTSITGWSKCLPPETPTRSANILITPRCANSGRAPGCTAPELRAESKLQISKLNLISAVALALALAAVSAFAQTHSSKPAAKKPAASTKKPAVEEPADSTARLEKQL